MNRSSGALLKICFSVLLRLCHLLQSETGYCQKWSENRTDFFFVFKLEFSWSILDGEMLICYWYRDYRGVGGPKNISVHLFSWWIWWKCWYVIDCFDSCLYVQGRVLPTRRVLEGWLWPGLWEWNNRILPMWRQVNVTNFINALDAS